MTEENNEKSVVSEEVVDSSTTINSVKVSFASILEILANKVSRKATIVAMAMVLIYMLAATPSVAAATGYILAISGLAIFFTLLQWIIDIKSDRPKGERPNGVNPRKVRDKIEGPDDNG